MTLGEKIKEARKISGYSQEQLAEQMHVSRSAIAKWETDKGLPDVENLKALSVFLNVPMETLLDEQAEPEICVTREPYTLSDEKKGSKRQKKDRIVRNRFPDAKIFPLLAHQKLTRAETILDNVLGFLTDAPFGIPDLLNRFKNTDKAFYYVLQADKAFFVLVTDAFIEIRRLTAPLMTDSFEQGDWVFRRCTYEVP